MGRLFKFAIAIGGALVIAGGGAYALAASSSGTITACARHRTGVLYQAGKCAKHDKKLSWNKQGRAGATGPAGKTGATGPAGSQGNTGSQGPAGPFPTTLPTGKTVVGTYDVEGEASAAGALATGAISYVYLAPSQDVIFVATGTTDPTCTGTAATPTAPNGYTCIYERVAEDTAGGGLNFETSSGVGIYVFSSASGHFATDGTFAATGP